MKKIFLFSAMVLVACMAFAQQRAQRLVTNGVTISLTNNGTALHFYNDNASGSETVYFVIYWETGGSQIEAFEIQSAEENKSMQALFGSMLFSLNGFNIDGSLSMNLDSRATAISLATAAQVTQLRTERERAAASERAQKEAAEKAERERREAAEKAERERREAAERERVAAAAERAAMPTYMENGTAAFNRSDWDGAIAEFSRVIRIDPKYAMAYNNRGAAYNGKNDWDRAIADFTEAISLDPNYAAAYRHRAYAYMQKGNYTQARTDVNRALQINPNYQNAKDLSAELQRRGH
jgi:tetratricopeptide (TPR) repeat protein